MTPNNQFASVTDYLLWLNTQLAEKIRWVRINELGNAAAPDGVSCTFSATADGKIKVDCLRCLLTLNMTSADGANASWLIEAMGLQWNLVNGVFQLGETSQTYATTVKSLTGTAPAPLVTAQRVTTNHGTMRFLVGTQTKRQHIDLSTMKDYPNQAALVNELNAQIAANSGLQTALTAVNGYIRFTLVPPTFTPIGPGTGQATPEHIAVTMYMGDLHLTSSPPATTTTDGLDIIRLIGKNFAASDGSFSLVRTTTDLQTLAFPNVTPLMQMPRDLYIYLPEMIADANVGGIETTLLRRVQMLGEIGTVQTYEPQYIQWRDISPSGMRLEQIHVVIRNAFGSIVEFEWGSITATIEFRPIMAAIAPAA